MNDTSPQTLSPLEDAVRIVEAYLDASMVPDPSRSHDSVIKGVA